MLSASGNIAVDDVTVEDQRLIVDDVNDKANMPLGFLNNLIAVLVVVRAMIQVGNLVSSGDMTLSDEPHNSSLTDSWKQFCSEEMPILLSHKEAHFFSDNQYQFPE
ncbi:hypothetical protein ACOSQ3_022310 [Xanthoceras sorbifolium]